MSTPHKRFRWKCLVYLERENYDVNVAWLSATKLVWEETRLIDQHLNWTSILYLKASPTSTDKQVSTPSCVPKSSDIQTSPMVSWISSCPKTALRWTFSHSYQHTIFNFTNTHTQSSKIVKLRKSTHSKSSIFVLKHLTNRPVSTYLRNKEKQHPHTHAQHRGRVGCPLSGHTTDQLHGTQPSPARRRHGGPRLALAGLHERGAPAAGGASAHIRSHPFT